MSECLFCGHQNEDSASICAKCNSRITVDVEEKNIDNEVLQKGHILIDRYEIEELINAGGMGAVYKTYDLRFDKKLCAIKELLDTSLDAKEKANCIRRFKREAKILSTLRHKYLPQVTDFFTIGNKYYLVMDYVDGYDLEILVGTEGKLEEDWTVELMLQVCDVLDYLHSQEPPIIYRDIKPSNIMVSNRDGKIRLVDFGIARTVEGEYGTSTRVGSLGYASPEHYNGIPDNRSDIYSLGVTMHSLLTGLSPDITFSFQEVRSINPDVSDRLNNIVMKAIRMKPEERFQDIKELIEALSGKEEVVVEDAKEYKQLEALTAQLNVNNPELKKEVIKTISLMKIDRAVYALLKTLEEDEDWRIRKEAALALQNFKTRRANLTKKLSEIYEKEVNSAVRASIIKTLGICRTPAALDLLISSLKDADEEVRFRAIIALGEIGDKRALGPLVMLMEDEACSLREDARMSIEKIDPCFLDSWYKKKKPPHDGNNIETIKFIFLLFILVFMGFLIFKYGKEYMHNIQIRDKIEEGDICLEAANYDKAIENYLFVVNIRPEESEVYYKLGIACLKNYDDEKAIEYLKKAIEFDKNNPLYKLELGKAFVENKNYDEAIKELEEALKLDSSTGEVNLYMGIAYARKGDKEKAREIFNYCSEKFPEFRSQAERQLVMLENTSLSLRLEEAEASLDYGRYDETIDICTEILSVSPDNYDAYVYRSNAYLKKNDFTRAQADLEKMLSINPVSGETCILLGHIHLEKENYSYAIEYSTKGIELLPSNPVPYLIRGIAYFKTGNKTQSKEDLRKYMEMDQTGEYASLAKEYLDSIEKGK